MTEASDLERLYRDAGDRLWWALLAYTGNREIASDAVAEAFARALNAAAPIRDPEAWVWRVAFRVATAELRSSRRTIQDRPNAYEMNDGAMAVLLALNKLSRRQRAVFALFYLDDRPAKEVAELLGLSPTTVSVHLHRARQRLRSIMEDDGD